MTSALNGGRPVLFGLALLALMTGCHVLTAATPPATIHYVAIDDGVSDTDLRTKVGEEVRWVNVRTAPVAVVFSGLVRDDLSCKRGFSKDEAARMTAIIFPDEYASLCFSKSAENTYRVIDVRRPGVELNHAAAVRVLATQ